MAAAEASTLAALTTIDRTLFQLRREQAPWKWLVCRRWPGTVELVGVITEKFTNATPRLFAKFNYRVKWFDGWQNHSLILDNYLQGPTAPYHSWVLLEKVDGVEDA